MKSRKQKASRQRAREARSPSAPPRPAAWRQSLSPAELASLPIPPILLEGDPPPESNAGEPALPSAQSPVPIEPPLDLSPASAPCGLFLIPRDPHSLFAGWGFTANESRDIVASSRDGNLWLQIYIDHFDTPPVAQVPLAITASHHFVPVARADAAYLAQLGYYSADGDWTSLSTSDPVRTPPDAPSTDTSLTLASLSMDAPPEVLPPSPPITGTTPPPPSESLGSPIADETANLIVTDFTADNEVCLIPPDALPDAQLSGPVQPTGHLASATGEPSGPVNLAIAPIPGLKPADGRPESPLATPSPNSPATPCQSETAPFLAVSLPAFAPAQNYVTGISSPPGGLPVEEPKKAFWFNLHTDLVLYGSTEPHAQVLIGGHPLKLRPDGSFTCHITLPEGVHELPIEVISAEGTTQRYLLMQVTRHIWQLGAK
jgi:hypothetical protein